MSTYRNLFLGVIVSLAIASGLTPVRAATVEVALQNLKQYSRLFLEIQISLARKGIHPAALRERIDNSVPPRDTRRKINAFHLSMFQFGFESFAARLATETSPIGTSTQATKDFLDAAYREHIPINTPMPSEEAARNLSSLLSTIYLESPDIAFSTLAYGFISAPRIDGRVSSLTGLPVSKENPDEEVRRLKALMELSFSTSSYEDANYIAQFHNYLSSNPYFALTTPDERWEVRNLMVNWIANLNVPPRQIKNNLNRFINDIERDISFELNKRRGGMQSGQPFEEPAPQEPAARIEVSDAPRIYHLAIGHFPGISRQFMGPN